MGLSYPLVVSSFGLLAKSSVTHIKNGANEECESEDRYATSVTCEVMKKVVVMAPTRPPPMAALQSDGFYSGIENVVSNHRVNIEKTKALQ